MERKKLKTKFRNLIIITFLAFNIGCDQITKNIARNNVDTGEHITVIPDFLTLTKIENSGAFLSLGDSLPFLIKTILLTILPILILTGMLAFILTKSKLELEKAIPLAFIIGGGIGNLYDRIAFGSVTDFLHMNFHVFQTGIFNIADVSIMSGTFWLLISTIKKKSPDIRIKDEPL